MAKGRWVCSIFASLLCMSTINAFSILPNIRLDRIYPQFQQLHSSKSATALHATGETADKSVFVVGSVNADIVVSIPRLPAAGETLLGSGGQVLPGGKGANQAVAAGRLASRFPGLNVKFCGVFGSDVHAPMLRKTMEDAAVNLDNSFDSSGPTGQAIILLQPGGENSIVLVPGANHDWPTNWESKVLSEMSTAKCVLLQREIPDIINIAVARHAKAHNIPVLLDLGGDDTPPPDELMECVDICAPNETELQRLVNMPTTTKTEISAAVKSLLKRVPKVLLTIGTGGSLLYNGTNDPIIQPCFKVNNPVDSTGAGDCFRGAYATALASGQLGEQASLELAAAASAHCVSVLGAMPSMPSSAQVDAVLARKA